MASETYHEFCITVCVLVENQKTDEWFLALTGGGMDLSPSIAYAYYLVQKWIPMELLQQLSAGWCKDSLSKEHFKTLREILVEQSKMESDRFNEKWKEWKQLQWL